MCHDSGYLKGDRLDFNDREFLAMAAFTLHALALLFLENDDLFGALVFEDLGLNRGAYEEGGTDLKIFAFASGEDFIDFNRGTGFRLGIAIDDEDVALANRELLPLCFDSGFHKFKGRNKGSGQRVSKNYFIRERKFSNVRAFRA